MAKAPWLLKGARGKVGNLVVAGSLGGSTIRAHADSVKNPKTSLQMTQRAKFANVIKFFKHANQNFFKFAFEDKKKNESDYNAFVRHNTKATTVFTYEQVQNPYFPAIGKKWLMTNGSLGSTICSISNDRVRLVVSEMEGTETTWGEACEKIIASFPGVTNGDFITMVGIRSYQESTFASIATQPTAWDIKQFTIDTNSTMELGDVINVAEGLLSFETVTDDDYACGGCMCISRKVDGGAKVTTTYLELNSVAENLFENASDEENVQYALQTWKTAGEAILQGSLVQ